MRAALRRFGRFAAVAIAALAGATTPAAAQQLTGAAKWADSAQRMVLAAWRTQQPEQLVAARAVAERALVLYPDDALLQLYRGYACLQEARLRSGAGGSGGGGEVENLLVAAEDALNRSIAKHETPEAHTLMSTLYGMRIRRDYTLKQTLGPQSGEQTERAISAGPNNPRAWLGRGIGLLNTPAEYGGGPAQALESLQYAVSLFAKDQPVPPNPSWGKADAHTWLGITHQRLAHADSARAHFQQALALEPSNGWVKGLLASLDAGH